MNIFADGGDGEALTTANAHRFDGIVEPLNLVCRPRHT
jgi:hypothetical protein